MFRDRRWYGAQIDLKNATIWLKDGGVGSAQQSLEVKIGEGTLTYDERKNIEYVRDRGLLDTVKEGDEEPIDVRFDFTWEFLQAVSTTAAGTPTVEDALKQRGEASGWVSSSSDPCEPYAVDIEVDYVPPCGGELDEIITLPDFRYTSLAHDLSAGTVAVTGQCNATDALIVRQ